MRFLPLLLFVALWLALGFTVGACASDSAKVRLQDIGLACDATHPCPAGTECGICGVGTGQCIAPCTATGSSECPSGSICSRAWSNTDVHICVRQCVHDIDCRTPTQNAGLSCNDGYLDPGTSGGEMGICNVSNSIGSVNRCP